MLSSDGGETTDAAVDSAYGHPPVVLLGVGLARASCFRVVFTVVNADRAHHIGWLKAVDVRRERFVPFFVRDEGNPKRRLVADVLIVGDESPSSRRRPASGEHSAEIPVGKHSAPASPSTSPLSFASTTTRLISKLHSTTKAAAERL
jgi:hypothetical protein